MYYKNFSKCFKTLRSDRKVNVYRIFCKILNKRVELIIKKEKPLSNMKNKSSFLLFQSGLNPYSELKHHECCELYWELSSIIIIPMENRSQKFLVVNHILNYLRLQTVSYFWTFLQNFELENRNKIKICKWYCVHSPPLHPVHYTSIRIYSTTGYSTFEHRLSNILSHSLLPDSRTHIKHFLGSTIEIILEDASNLVFDGEANDEWHKSGTW